jgi:hypothetical protein
MKLFSRRSTLATSASFQGIGGAAAAKPTNDDDMKKQGKKEGEEKTDDDTNAGAAPATTTASSDNDDDDDDDDDEDGCDESDEADMKGTKGKKVAAARLRERARVAAVMSHSKAAAHPDFALKMALTTDFGRGKILSMLDALPAAAAANTLAARMSTEANRHVGAAPSAPSRQAAIDAGWERAAARAKDPFAA